MSNIQEVYGPFRSGEMYELIEQEGREVNDIGSVVSKIEEAINPDTYEDLVDIYGEEVREFDIEVKNEGEHLSDIQEGVGCTEIWEKLSAERN